MASQIELFQLQDLESENACVVCFKSCLIYSIGSCNHAVCFECSSRMRCLCLQNECPICRQDLPKVIFTKTVAPFLTLDRELRSGLYEKKFRIAFADREIQNEFYYLLEDRCSQCNHTPFIEFNKLRDHVRKHHELHYCDICTDNLKVFSSERRCYSRSDLARHRRVGDPDDKSHKGHPICEYCELRFLDKDELFRHLRREHYYCHLCDADGINLFYGHLSEMRAHFKKDHFLCEEDECVDEQFTAVFRSEIDLRAHIALVHSHGMSKLEVKQARTIDLEFSYAPRGRGAGGTDNARGGRRHRDNDNHRDNEPIPEQTIVQQPPIKIDAKNEEQFPSLGGPSASHVQLSNTVRHITYGTAGLARTKENFPALGGLPETERPRAPQPQKAQPSSGKQYKAPTASSMLRGSTKQQSSNRPASSGGGLKNTAADFPALSQSTSKNSFDFPALSQITSKKPSPAHVRQQAAPKAAAYPSLSQGSAKKNKTKNELLLEDMVVPTSSVDLNLVSYKHRGLVEDYVSMASKVSKVQTVQQKDIQSVPQFTNQSVPKLSSADNFPSLGGGASSSSAPQWCTVKGGGKLTEDSSKKGKKVHEMPVKGGSQPSNGIVKSQNKIDGRKTNGSEKKDKPKANNNKENKNFPIVGSEPTAPPGFAGNGQQPKKTPPGFTSLSSFDEFTYTAPTNASKRNQALVGEFQKALKSPESMQEFRNVSQMYRDGNYFAKSYYETCKHVLGVEFESIFPELLALLPDIEKQQNLYLAHQEDVNQHGNAEKKSKKKNKSKEFDVCSICQQVLVMSDSLSHKQSHSLESNYPQLG